MFKQTIFFVVSLEEVLETNLELPDHYHPKKITSGNET